MRQVLGRRLLASPRILYNLNDTPSCGHLRVEHIDSSQVRTNGHVDYTDVLGRGGILFVSDHPHSRACPSSVGLVQSSQPEGHLMAGNRGCSIARGNICSVSVVNPGNTCSSHDGMVQMKSNTQCTHYPPRYKLNPILSVSGKPPQQAAAFLVTRPPSSHRSPRWLHCVGIMLA